MARILIVDDERSMCQLLEIAFRKDGHQVETALRGDLAKRKLESQIFDLVISDIRMPDLTGLDLLQHIRTISPETYVILITAYATIDSAVQAVNLGAYRYIIKTDKLMEELHPSKASESFDFRKNRPVGETIAAPVRRTPHLDLAVPA